LTGNYADDFDDNASDDSADDDVVDDDDEIEESEFTQESDLSTHSVEEDLVSLRCFGLSNFFFTACKLTAVCHYE